MRHCYVLRVFTRQGEGGNLLGVVTDVTGLSEDVMQSIAADLGYSETVFIDWRQPGDPSVRIFTPAMEMPFAGHPLVGAGWVLSVMGPGGPEKLSCGIGDVGLRVVDGEVWIEPPPERPVFPDDEHRPAWVDSRSRVVVEMPLRYLLVEVGDPAAVVTAGPPPPGWGDAVMLWSWAEAGSLVKARFFAGGLGVAEDPATGSAAVALAAALTDRGIPEGSIAIHQGDEVGFPSTINLRWSPGHVAIGGAVAKDRVIELEK